MEIIYLSIYKTKNRPDRNLKDKKPYEKEIMSKWNNLHSSAKTVNKITNRNTQIPKTYH